MPQKQETLPNGTLVFTNKTHKIGSDSLLLASFCPVKPGWSACDLGAGCGVLLLSLIDRGLVGPTVAVEQDPTAAALLEAAKAANHLDGMAVIHGDLRDHTALRLFDLVIANPPYFNAGALPFTPARAAARHETHCTLAQLCAAAARLLKERGHFCLCYPPARLAELFACLSQHALAPKRLQLVRKTAGDVPWLALVEARKAGGTGLSILPDLLLPAASPLVY